MGMDISYKEHRLHQNWTGWSALREMLVANGFEGTLPNTNDSETVSKKTAKEVGKAMLKFYQQRADKECILPELSRHESACLAYALLLCVADGKAQHS